MLSATRDWHDSRNIPDPDHRFEIKSQSLMFDGDKVWHASESFSGQRW